MNIAKPRRIRRTHSEEFKRSLIEACDEPDASVAGIALATEINANQLCGWMCEPGLELPALSNLPVRPVTDLAAGFIPVQFPRNTDAPIRLDARVDRVIRVEALWLSVAPLDMSHPGGVSLRRGVPASRPPLRQPARHPDEGLAS